MEAQKLRTYRFTLHPEGFDGIISVAIEARDEQSARQALYTCVCYDVEYRDANAQTACYRDHVETACYRHAGTLEERAALLILGIFLHGQGERLVGDLWKLADKAHSVASRFARKRGTQNEDTPPPKRSPVEQWAAEIDRIIRQDAGENPEKP